jgi:hypothetical protein
MKGKMSGFCGKEKLVKKWPFLLSPLYIKCFCVLQIFKPSKMQSLGKCCTKLVSYKLKLLMRLKIKIKEIQNFNERLLKIRTQVFHPLLRPLEYTYDNNTYCV